LKNEGVDLEVEVGVVSEEVVGEIAEDRVVEEILAEEEVIVVQEVMVGGERRVLEIGLREVIILAEEEVIVVQEVMEEVLVDPKAERVIFRGQEVIILIGAEVIVVQGVAVAGAMVEEMIGHKVGVHKVEVTKEVRVPLQGHEGRAVGQEQIVEIKFPEGEIAVLDLGEGEGDFR